MSSPQNITRSPINDAPHVERGRPNLPSIHDLFGNELAQPPRPTSHTGYPSPSLPSMHYNVRPDLPGGLPYAAYYPATYGHGQDKGPRRVASPGAAEYRGVPRGHTSGHPPPPAYSTGPGLSHTSSRHSDAPRGVHSPPTPPERGRYSTTDYSNDPSYSSDSRNLHGAQRAPSSSPAHRHAASGMAMPAGPPSFSSASYPRGMPTHNTITLPAGPSNYDPVSAHSSRYECQVCGKGFTRPSSLKIHNHSHTGVKPFECTFEGCERRFSVKSNMRRHARTHQHPNAPDVQETSEDDQLDEGDDSPVTPPHSAGSSAARGGRGN